MLLTITWSGRQCLRFPASVSFLQLVVIFIAVLIARVQKLVVMCKVLITDPNDCAPPSPVCASLMFSLNCPNSKAGCTYQAASFSSEKKTDSKGNRWFEDARQVPLKDGQKHWEYSRRERQRSGCARLQLTETRLLVAPSKAFLHFR